MARPVRDDRAADDLRRRALQLRPARDLKAPALTQRDFRHLVVAVYAELLTR